ncbi:MAG: hypothetical protein GOV02_00585 [Candidatus Aenigmarchaeota archaeon]|nr:hypothetical protein [Candidatus Aenigmarchaeota archaeon]
MTDDDKPCEFSDGNLNEINRCCTNRNENCTYNNKGNGKEITRCDIYPIQKGNETSYLEKKGAMVL